MKMCNVELQLLLHRGCSASKSDPARIVDTVVRSDAEESQGGDAFQFPAGRAFKEGLEPHKFTPED